MASLIAIAYPDAATAEQVREELGRASKEFLVELHDAVVVERDADGKVKLRQTHNPAGTVAGAGGMMGGVIGLLFLAPLLGMALGAASGALVGKMTDVGINDDFMKELGAKLPTGGAALIALGRSDTPERVLERLAPFGGEVIQTSLSEEDEARLRSALGEPAATAR
jgi:uncharacterized membrane protein